MQGEDLVDEYTKSLVGLMQGEDLVDEYYWERLQG